MWAVCMPLPMYSGPHEHEYDPKLLVHTPPLADRTHSWNPVEHSSLSENVEHVQKGHQSGHVMLTSNLHLHPTAFNLLAEYLFVRLEMLYWRAFGRTLVKLEVWAGSTLMNSAPSRCLGQDSTDFSPLVCTPPPPPPSTLTQFISRHAVTLTNDSTKCLQQVKGTP